MWAYFLVFKKKKNYKKFLKASKTFQVFVYKPEWKNPRTAGAEKDLRARVKNKLNKN